MTDTNARPYVGLDTQKIKGRAGLYAELKKPAFLQQDAGINVADLLIGEIKNNPTARDMFLNMHECANLKADVLLNLRHRALPDIKVFDVVWNTLDGTIRLSHPRLTGGVGRPTGHACQRGPHLAGHAQQHDVPFDLRERPYRRFGGLTEQLFQVLVVADRFRQRGTRQDRLLIP